MAISSSNILPLLLALLPLFITVSHATTLQMGRSYYCASPYWVTAPGCSSRPVVAEPRPWGAVPCGCVSRRDYRGMFYGMSSCAPMPPQCSPYMAISPGIPLVEGVNVPMGLNPSCGGCVVGMCPACFQQPFMTAMQPPMSDMMCYNLITGSYEPCNFGMGSMITY